MQLPSFILHGWLCYYNDGELVKEKFFLSFINQTTEAIKIIYKQEEEKKAPDMA
jgi:hypothetical protein